MSEAFIGEIRMFGFAFAPVGWAFCDGSVMSISQNTALFSILGTTYGGDGVTNFWLPNLYDAIPISVGQGPGLSDRQLGEAVGSGQVTLTVQTIAQHDHSVNGRGTTAAQLTAGPDATSLLSRAFTQSTPVRSSQMYSSVDAVDTVMSTATIGNAGSSQSHENRQPFLALNMCIALEGIYPSRS